jgi:uncharacterized protein (DUF488 family)
MYDAKGKPDYRKMRATAAFNQGIDRLVELAEDKTVAVMCAEEDPGKCHRLLHLGPALAERGVELRHIRRDGAGFPSQETFQATVLGQNWSHTGSLWSKRS